MERTKRSGVLTVNETAAELHCSPALIRKLVKAGQIPAVTVSTGEQRRAVRILEADVVAYLAAINEPKPAA
jgi:excisionase family DNA binding protein